MSRSTTCTISHLERDPLLAKLASYPTSSLMHGIKLLISIPSTLPPATLVNFFSSVFLCYDFTALRPDTREKKTSHSLYTFCFLLPCPSPSVYTHSFFYCFPSIHLALHFRWVWDFGLPTEEIHSRVGTCGVFLSWLFVFWYFEHLALLLHLHIRGVPLKAIVLV